MPTLNPPQNDSNQEQPKENLIHALIQDITSQVKPERREANHALVTSLAEAAMRGNGVDDKQYVAEKLIQALASLSNGSKLQNFGTGLLVKKLWDDLQHPPLSYMGGSYGYRTADGSNNNVLFPHIGRSGSFYARTVTPKHIPTNLPDPEVVFDTLLARRGSVESHPNKISSLLFALATIIIHDCFRTNDQDSNIISVSSYLDLSPLYGSTQNSQDSIRTFKDGKLKPDTFAEERMLMQPPECAALLICFNRFHNYIASELASINEGGRFDLAVNSPEPDTSRYIKAIEKRDNDLFQVARLVTSGLYIHVVLGDYIRTILNLHRTDSKWNLDPLPNYEEAFGHGNIEQGIGNQVSVEFNLIYRWHSVVSGKNERWLNDFFVTLFPGKAPKDVTLPEFRAGMRSWALKIPPDPSQWTFGDFQRTPDGSFRDDDLVKILTEATEDVAGSFGPRRIPSALRAVEIIGIQQSREWRVATLNELRRHFGLRAHESFLDINSDPDIAKSLEILYGNVENVELYPGVVVEDAKDSMTPGSGLCAPYTTTRAILSDAVSLTRGDRFYTIDYSPSHLTSFGFKTASNDDSITEKGVLYKLLMRAFPGWYRSNSIYALYPFTSPTEMRMIKRGLGNELDYDYTPPEMIGWKSISTWRGVSNILNDYKSFKVPWGLPLGQLNKFEFMLGVDTPSATVQRRTIGYAIYGPETSLEELPHFLEVKTAELLRKNSYKICDVYEIDLTRQVSALSWMQFAAQLFGIPVKDGKDSDASFDAGTQYEMLGKIYPFTFVDSDTTHSISLKQEALKAYEKLTAEIKPVCEGIKRPSALAQLLPSLGSKSKDNLLPNHGKKLLQRLIESGKSIDEIVSWIVLLAVAIVVLSSQALSQIVDLFLTEPYYSTHWPIIQRLSRDPSPSASEKLRRYVIEALRLVTPTTTILRISDMDSTITDGSNTYQVKKGDRILLDIAQASRDPTKFSSPEEIHLDRPEDAYLHFGQGMHTCLGRYIAVYGLAAQLRVFGRLKGLRRAPGNAGRLITKNTGGAVKFLSDKMDSWGSLPSNMKVRASPSDEKGAII